MCVNKSGKEASEMDKVGANFNLMLRQQPLRANNICPDVKAIDGLSQSETFERRRSSLPSNSPQEEQPGALRHPTSEPLLSQMDQNRELKLG